MFSGLMNAFDYINLFRYDEHLQSLVIPIMELISDSVIVDVQLSALKLLRRFFFTLLPRG